MPQVRERLTRKCTSRLLELVDEGVLNPNDLLRTALGWMSEDDVKEMCERNDIQLFPEDDDGN